VKRALTNSGLNSGAITIWSVATLQMVDLAWPIEAGYTRASSPNQLCITGPTRNMPHAAKRPVRAKS
jgi:hypothetical protein